MCKKTEQMSRELSVHSAMFEVDRLAIYEEDPMRMAHSPTGTSTAESAEPIAP